ncbi:MAG: two pore domain potassium channel family protein [Phycisphaerae bacterium]|nr:two pore domain potassium channel family protein [Phycisphaerae bacterium]
MTHTGGRAKWLAAEAKRVLPPGMLRFSSAHLLAAIVLLIIVSPFLEISPIGVWIEAVLATLVLAAGVTAVGGQRNSLIVAAALVIPSLSLKWAHLSMPESVPAWSFRSVTLLFLGFLTGRLLRFALRAPRADWNVLCAAVCVYLLMGLFWAVAYTLIAEIDPSAFAVNASGGQVSGFNALYFSFTVQTTVGFGDIAPVTPVAKLGTLLQSTLGVFYVTLLIASLVSRMGVPDRPVDHH